MKVYCVYCSYGEDSTMVRIYADKSKAQEYVNTENFEKNYDAHWFLLESEVLQ